jgi:hypothetical protein
MNSIRTISVTVRNAVLVTLAVIIGFCVGDALGLPVWLQAVCLIPAIILFYRLAENRRPSTWKLFGLIALLTIYVFIFHLGSKFIPERYFLLYFILLPAVFPFRAISNWAEKRLETIISKNEQDAPRNR